MFHEIGEGIVDGLGLDMVKVIQHQQGVCGELVQGVEQGCEYVLDRWGRRGVQQRQRGLADPGCSVLEALMT